MSIAYIDWGGTNFRCVVEGDGVWSYEKPSQSIDIISELTRLFESHPDISKVGISFAGQVSCNKILGAPNIEVEALDLGDVFGQKTILVQNDLKCAALAEARYWGEKNIAALYVGTGIGSAYIDDGRLVYGVSNTAGEIGHIPYKKTSRRCGCGKDNCLELVASGSGLHKMCEEAKIEFLGLESLTGDDRGADIAKEFIEGVGYAASLIITMLNPKILTLGGGIVFNNEWMLEEIKKYVRDNGFKKNVDECNICISRLKNGSLEGAKLLLQ